MSGFLVWIQGMVATRPMSLQECINFLLFNNFFECSVVVEEKELGETIGTWTFQ